MSYLLLQMIFCLLASGLLGLLLGWLLFGGRSDAADPKQVKALEASLGAARLDAEACFAARSDLEKQLTAAIAERDTARAEAEAMIPTDMGATSRVVDLEEELEAANAKLAVADAAEARISELESSLAAATAAAAAGAGAAGLALTVDDSTTDGEDLRARVAELQQQLADQERTASDLLLDRDNARARLAAQEARMLALKTDADGARADLADARRRMSTVESKLAQVTGDDDADEATALRTRVAELEGRLSQMTRDDEATAALRARITELENQLDQPSANELAAKARITELEASLVAMPTIESEQGRITALEEELSAAKASLALGALGAGAAVSSADNAALAASEARYEALRLRFEKSNLNYLKLLGERSAEGANPSILLDAPRGQADDLKKIKGVGPVLEGMLNGLGIYHFWQIAKFSMEDIAWIVAKTETFPDRIIRDRWVEQAGQFVKRIERGESI